MNSTDRRTFALAVVGPAAFSTAKAKGPDLAKLWADVPHWLELAFLTQLPKDSNAQYEKTPRQPCPHLTAILS
jgi:hypothetical protein